MADDKKTDGDNSQQEAIDFASAKNFWQTRATRAQSRDAIPMPISLTSTGSSSDLTSSSTSDARPSVVNTGHTVPTPATPVEQYPEELEHEAKHAKDDDKASPPQPPPAPSMNTTATAALQRMTSFTRSKFFSTSTDGAKADDTSPPTTGTMPSLPNVQLPDMSAWKGKMKLGRPTPPKMNFSFEKLSTQLKTSLNNAALVMSDADKAANLALARNNIHRPHQPNTRRPSAGSASASTAGSHSELVVAEILAAKELSAGDFFQGESDPYVIVTFREWERRTAIVKSSKNPVFNERFVFWVSGQSSEPSENLLSVQIRNKNMVMADEHLGEVHISLDIPLNEAFDEWYPLVKENGEQKGSIRVGVRRMELTTPELEAAGQALASNNRSLNDDDLAAYGSVLPDLWYGFAEAAEPLETKVSQADVLATKLNDLSRRFIGIEIASTEVTSDGHRRDIF